MPGEWIVMYIEKSEFIITVLKKNLYDLRLNEYPNGLKMLQPAK